MGRFENSVKELGCNSSAKYCLSAIMVTNAFGAFPPRITGVARQLIEAGAPGAKRKPARSARAIAAQPEGIGEASSSG